MTRITCTRRLQFCAGHRVYGHENKCANLHGHNYVVYLTAAANPVAESQLDDIGRVIDFSVLKYLIGEWIQEKWDHGMILSKDDPLGWIWDGGAHFASGESPDVGPTCTEHKFFEMPYNPTAENMARYLGEEVAPDLLRPKGIQLVKVVMHETENCSAEWTL